MQSASHIENDESRSELLRRLLDVGVSERVISAMMQVPRDRFVPSGLQSYAWIDESLPISQGQTISQPSLVGRMIDQLETQPAHRVLDVGTGSGYQAAILSLLVDTVISVERIPTFRVEAKNLLQVLGYDNIHVFEAGDGLGWPDLAPYDGIIVGAAAPEIPDALVQQLKVGGRLVIPVGTRSEQQIVVIERTETGTKEMRHEPVRFVPLIGKEAWKSE